MGNEKLVSSMSPNKKSFGGRAVEEWAANTESSDQGGGCL